MKKQNVLFLIIFFFFTFDSYYSQACEVVVYHYNNADGLLFVVSPNTKINVFFDPHTYYSASMSGFSARVVLQSATPLPFCFFTSSAVTVEWMLCGRRAQWRLCLGDLS